MINQPYQPSQVLGQQLGQQPNSQVLGQQLGQQPNSQVQGTSYKIGNGIPTTSPTPGMVSPSSTSVPPLVSSGSPMTPSGTVASTTTAPLQYEQSYIENILRLNIGKFGTFYMTYEGNKEWNARIFQGIVEAAGRDHIIIADPKTGRRFILLMVNFDYATFDEPLLYQYPGVVGNVPQAPSRR